MKKEVMIVSTSDGVNVRLDCKLCKYVYVNGDSSEIAFVNGKFIHVGCNDKCNICGLIVEESDICFRNEKMYHQSCINKLYHNDRCNVHRHARINDFNIFWPIADLRNNWKQFPKEYRAYMLEQYKIIRLATNIPKEIVWMIVERAIYPYGYATNVQNGLIVKDYCIGLCEYSERCRCGEYLKYLDNYSPMCQNGVCSKFPCANCGCSDCGTKCLRKFSNFFISKNITPVYDELFALFKDSLKGTDLGTNQIPLQMAYLIKTNFYSLPQDIQTKLIHTLFTP